MKHFKPGKVYQVFNYFLVLCISLGITLFVMLYFIEKNVIEIKRDELKQQQLAEIEIESMLLVDEFDYIISDLDFLTTRFEEFVTDGEFSEANISDGWETFSEARQIYDQIRYIDRQGDEIIRVNLGIEGAYLVTEYALQNKADRYYFTDTIRLEKGQVFVSKMDLNVENGSIEIPNKPMVRFAEPVYHNDYEPMGIVVLNYKAEGILDKFQGLPKEDRKKLYLLDANGYWLSSDNPMEEWTFMYRDKQHISFKNRFPDVWKQMENASGQIITDDGMFTYSKIFLGETLSTKKAMMEEEKVVLDEGEWIVVSYNPADGPNGYLLYTDFWHISRLAVTENIMNFVFMAIAAAVTAVFVYLNRLSKARIAYYSTYDALTGAYNRRGGFERLTAKLPQGSRRKCGICFIFLDVNGLKDINDTLGHDQGDELIVSVASVIMNTIREEDMLIRMGGDEFLIVLNQANESDAEIIWQRIVQNFRSINETESRPYLISASHGIVAADSCEHSSIDEVIKIADERMYEEKRQIKVGLDVIKKET